MVTGALGQRLPLPMDIPAFILEAMEKPESVDEVRWAEALDFEVVENWEEAAIAWEDCLASAPDDSALRLRTAARYLQIGNSPKVRELLSDLTVSDPLQDQTQRHLKAVCEWLERDDRTAWRELIRLVQETDPFIATYHMLARVCLSQNQPAEAVGWLRHTLIRIPFDQRLTAANHPVFAPLASEPAFRKLIREEGGFTRKQSLVEEDEPLPPHLQPNLSIESYELKDFQPPDEMDATEGGFFFQGLHLQANPEEFDREDSKDKS